jgi:hypothetical protein
MRRAIKGGRKRFRNLIFPGLDSKTARRANCSDSLVHSETKSQKDSRKKDIAAARPAVQSEPVLLPAITDQLNAPAISASNLHVAL